MISIAKPGEESVETSSTDAVPSNWPGNVTFLHDQVYSDAVTQDQKAALSRSSDSNAAHPTVAADALRASRQCIEIQTIIDNKHPACGGGGLSAAQHGLMPDSFICLYLGKVHSNALSDTDPHSDYDLSYDREIGLSIDSAHCGNESRFINDYRGIAERPNAEFRDCFVQVKSEKRANGTKWERRVGIFVLSAGKAGKRQAGIRVGEEILVNYGKSFWEARQVLARFRKDSEMRTSADHE